MAVSAEFRKGLARSKDAKARLTAAKKARPGGDFNAPDLPKGAYILRVTAEANKTSKGNLYARLNWMIMKGEFAKTSFYKDFFLEGDNDEMVQKNWDALSKAVQVLADIGEEELADFENWSTDDLCDVLDKIDSEAPLVRATLNPWISKSNGNRNLDVWFNSLIEDVASEELDVDPDDIEGEEEEADGEEATDEGDDGVIDLEALGVAADDGDEDALAKLAELAEAAGIDPDEYDTWAELAAALPEEEAEEEEEEVEEVVISKDDFVYYKPKGKRTAVKCKVLSSNKAKEEATIAEVADAKKKYSAVPWASCELVEEE